MLTKHVRYYGDDIAAVIAEDEISAQKAVNAIRVEYEYLPFVLDVHEAMSGSAPLIHGEYKNNILDHSQIHIGKYDEAAKEPGLIRVEGWYDTPTVQHCHIENAICYSWEEAGKINVVSSTQIPHIMRRIIAQALGVEWEKVRVIKPYIGGGFGNKQDALYEPLCAWLSTQAGGRLVKLECQREETFMNTRVRHAIRFHIISWLREDGKLIARKAECYSNQGAYASHGHAVCANALASIPQIYPCENFEGEGWTVFTNRQAAGAMRGYGIPQATFAVESHTEDICARLGLDSAEYRRKNVMPKGYVDPFSKNELYYDTFSQTLDAGIKYTGYYRKRSEYANQSGNVRRGIGLALFWYKTGVWPTALEKSACRMTMNQDGSIQLQVCETEIGQGADTAFSQMAAETLGIPFEKVHIVSSQDTDVTPFGLRAYASRQTYAAGMSIRNCAEAFKAHILETAYRYT